MWPIYEALHDCDNPPCCNGSHLFDGTNLDNVADRQAKNRQARGLATTSNATITQEDASIIRQSYARGDFTQQQLADMYGIKQQAISKIILGQRWR